MKKVFCLLFIFVSVSAVAQKKGQALVDSFLMELPKAKEDTNKTKILYKLSLALSNVAPDQGVQYGMEAMQLSTQLNWKSGIAYASNSLGANYQSKKDTGKMLEYYEQALKIHKEIKNKAGIVVVLRKLAEYYYSLGDYAKAIEFFLPVVKITEETGSKRNIAYNDNQLGCYYMMNGNYPQALELFYKALKVFEGLGNNGGIALVTGNLGNVCMYDSKFPEAMEYYKKYLAISEKIRDTDFIADATANLCEAYKSLTSNNEALEYCFTAIKKMQEYHKPHVVALANRCISEIYTKRRDYIRAIYFGRKAFDMVEATDDPSEIEYTMSVLGNAYLQLAEDSTTVHDKATDAAEAEPGKRLPANLIPKSKSAKLDLAIDYLERARVSSQSYKKIDVLLDSYNKLTRAYKLKGDYLKSLESYKIYVVMKDSLFSKENEKRLIQQQMQYEYDKKEVLGRTELLKQKREKLFLMGGAMLMLLIAGGSVYFLIYTRKAKKLVEEQKNRAERSERFKQQFLANMSHEIRTPMNAVLGMTNLALDNPLTPKVNNYLTAVKKSSENLLVIINDVLDLSKLEAGKMDLEKIPFRLSEQVRQVYDTMHFKAEEKGLILLTRIAKDIPDILIGDPSRLNQVLINLCGNAIKFTEKGTVRIVVEQVTNLTPALSKGEGDVTATLCFKVIDSGIGIPTDKLGRLFESFNQADASTARKYGGTGLGLSISKTLVELQGGRMDVRSTEGEGSEFSFVIEYHVADEKAMLEVATGSKAHPAWLQGIRILVAEDNEYNQVVIKDTLHNLIKDVKVDVADNGKIAIERLQADDYDVILMDAQMPEMTGLEASVYIRKNMQGRKQGIPIIALTASVLNTDLSKCTDAGMNAYVPKPFKREELLNTLARFYKNEQGKEIEKKVVDADERIAGTEQTTGNVTDLSFLHDFCDGDRERMKKYIDIYLKVTPGNLEKIGIALNNKDYAVLAKMVHAMKAHLNYMGMKQTRELAEQMERYALEEKYLTDLPQMIAQLQRDWERSRAELG